MEQHGKNWKLIGNKLDRLPHACAVHYRHILNQNLKWNEEYDELLLSLVKIFKKYTKIKSNDPLPKHKIPYHAISNFMPGFAERVIQGRYMSLRKHKKMSLLGIDKSIIMMLDWLEEGEYTSIHSVNWYNN